MTDQVASPETAPFTAVTSHKKSTIIKEGQRERTSKAKHYVDNERFFTELVEFTEKQKAWEKESKIVVQPRGYEVPVTLKSPPKIPNFIGECVYKIANKLSTMHYFNRYTYRDEMVADAIENCIRAIRNCTFDVQKSHNPFSYFTQISYYAFMRRIEIEKKQAYVRYKGILSSLVEKGETYTEQEGTEGDSEVEVNSDFDVGHLEQYVDKFESKYGVGRAAQPRARRKRGQAVDVADGSIAERFADSKDGDAN